MNLCLRPRSSDKELTSLPGVTEANRSRRTQLR